MTHTLPPVAADAFRQTLISSAQSINVPSAEIARERVTPNCPVNWSIRKITLHGGKQEGVDLVVVDNGRLRMAIIPTRGMGIYDVTMGDVRLGWDSPVHEIVNPAFVNLQNHGGSGWLEGFNEWLVRCGLENNGSPGDDRIVSNDGSEKTVSLTLHGRIANIPAHEVEVIVDRHPPYRLRIRGRVAEAQIFGPRLELQTEISTEPGSDSFRVSDVVINRGAEEQEFQMLYHCNFGRPLLEAGATFLAPLDCVAPMTAFAAKGIGKYAEYTGPEVGFPEQVYCMTARSDDSGRTLAMLRNAAQDRAVLFTYSPKELPCLTQWKRTAAELDGYITGIEPGTNFPQHRSMERKAGRVPRLAPGAAYGMSLDFTILAGADAVSQAAGRIARIQGGVAPRLEAKPLKSE